MVNEHQPSLGEQQQLDFEDEEEVLEPLYLSERANLILAKETILNLAYYFHINKNATLDSYKKIKNLFPKAVHLMEKEGYTLAKAAILELENKLVKIHKNINNLNARCIILMYKLIAYEKNHKRGRSRGFMTLSELSEKDIWKLKELTKRTFDFFEENPGGSLKVNLTNKEYVTDQSMFIDYLTPTSVVEILLAKEDQEYIPYQALENKKYKYNAKPGIERYYRNICVFDPCTSTKYIPDYIQEEDDGISSQLIYVTLFSGAVIAFLIIILSLKGK